MSSSPEPEIQIAIPRKVGGIRGKVVLIDKERGLYRFYITPSSTKGGKGPNSKILDEVWKRVQAEAEKATESK